MGVSGETHSNLGSEHAAMAGTITITCPECETTMKVSADVEGKKVRCKSCKQVFVAGGKKPAAVAKGAIKKAVKGGDSKPAAKESPKPAKEPPKPAPEEPKKPDLDDDDGD